MTTEAGAKRAERLWIKELGTFGRGGYNATTGGDGCIPSDEARAKMSKAQLRRPPKSPETCAKISAAKIGKKHSPETIAKISEAVRPSAAARAEAQRGKKRPLETCTKMADAKLNMPDDKRAAWCARMSAVRLGRPWSPARRAAHDRKKAT